MPSDSTYKYLSSHRVATRGLYLSKAAAIAGRGPGRGARGDPAGSAQQEAGGGNRAPRPARFVRNSRDSPSRPNEQSRASRVKSAPGAVAKPSLRCRTRAVRSLDVPPIRRRQVADRNRDSPAPPFQKDLFAAGRQKAA